MTSAWDARPGESARIRRIRGGEEVHPTPRPQRLEPVKIVDRRRAADEDGLTFMGVDLDGVFALGIFLPMLYLTEITTLGAALIAAMVPLYMFVRRERLMRTLTPRAFLFIVPAFAVLSTIWSVYPKDTLRHAMEFGVTVLAGVMLASARSQTAVLRGIALAFAIYVVHSVVAGGFVVVGVGMGGEAFSGLTDSKNLQADISSTGLVVTAVVVTMAIQSRSWLWVLGGLVAIGFDLYSVVMARSAGAMLGLAVAVMSFGVLIPLVYAGKVVRAWATSMLAITLVVVAANYQTLSSALMNLGATLFDKDSTLTGRTYLWYRAAELIHEKPVLGRGYNAFWVQGNTDAEGLWQFFEIVDRDGFTFHNTYVQTLVELGWVGLMLVLATATIGVVFLIRRFVQKPSLALVFWIGIMMYEMARTPIEVVGILPFYWSSVFIFGALGAAFSRERARKPQTGATSSALSIATPVLVAVGSAPLTAQRPPRPRRAALRLVKSGPEAGL